MNSAPKDLHWRYLALLLIAFLPGSYSLATLPDNDYWWHLRVGEWVWQNGTVPSTDPFSRPGIEEHIPWMAYSWLFEIAAYGSHRLFDQGEGIAVGMAILKTFFNAITFLSISFLILRRQGPTWRAIAVLALTMIPVTNLMSERPWHFTIWFTVATLAVVDSALEGNRARWHWLLPLAYIVWANTHIQFILGLGVLGLAFLEASRRSLQVGQLLPEWSRVLLLGIACTVATLANPYHYKLWIVIREYATQTTALRNVQELLPPEFDEWRQWVLLALFGLAGISLIHRRLPAWETLLFAAGLFFSLRMRRDIWFGAIVSAMVLLPRKSPNAGEWSLPRWSLPICTLLGLALTRLLFCLPQATDNPEFRKTEADIFPVEAVAWLKANPLPGPMFNNFDWGGYLIWALREYPVSVDGRTNLFGEERLRASFRTWTGSEGWEDNADLKRAGFVLAPVGTGEKPVGLTERLLEQREFWKVVHRDRVAVIFVPAR